MADVILDASAVLAYLNGEPGADRVAAYVGNARISAVNVAEVETQLMLHGAPLDVVRTVLDLVGLDVVDFDRELADIAAGLAVPSRQFGLSLGDRACLALAMRDGKPAVTADRAWKKLDLDGLQIEMIRS